MHAVLAIFCAAAGVDIEFTPGLIGATAVGLSVATLQFLAMRSVRDIDEKIKAHEKKHEATDTRLSGIEGDVKVLLDRTDK